MKRIYNEKYSEDNPIKNFSIRINMKPPTNLRTKNLSHWHDYYEILYLYDDNTEIYIENKSYKAKKNSIVFLTPYVIHDTHNLNETVNKELVCHFSTSFIETIFYDKEFFHLLTANYFLKKTFFINIQNKTATEALESLLEHYPPKSNTHQSYMLLQGLLFVLFNSIFEDVKYFPNTFSDDPDFSLTDIHKYIQRKINKQEDITLIDVSKKLNYEPTYFSKKFKKTFGLSFKDYVISLKMQRAQKLLQTTNLPIAQIAKELNYQNTQNFCRAYNDFFGITPYQHKKNMDTYTHRK